MAKSVSELREEGVKLAQRIQQLRDKCHSDDGWTEEERAEWQTVGERYNEVTRQADELESVNAQAEAIARSQEEANKCRTNPGRGDVDGRRQGDNEAPTEEDRDLALQAWCRNAYDIDLEERHTQAAERCGLRLTRGSLNIGLGDTQHHNRVQRYFRTCHPDLAMERAMQGLAEQRAPMSGQLGGSGGFLKPSETFLTTLEINRLAFGGMLQAAEVINTTTGEHMAWPTADDTSNTGEQVDENTNVDNSGAGGPTPTIAKVYWDAYKFSSKAILVPYELMEDSAFNLAAVLAQMIGERIGRVTNQKYTTGNGNATAYGIVNRATLGKTAASATAIIADELIQLEHSVDPAYRMGAGYMMHDNTVLAVRLLKDNEGRYLWQSGLTLGRPDMLNGRPVTINQDMASSIAASAKTVLFGQLNRYKIRRVRSMRLYRLQELYRNSDQDGFIAFVREDGNLLDAGTSPVKYLQQNT